MNTPPPLPPPLSVQMNVFVLILAYRSAATLRVNQQRAKKEKLKRWLKGWFSLSCLLGVQWAIGYIYVDGSDVFDYVFTALNCSQVSPIHAERVHIDHNASTLITVNPHCHCSQ